MAQQPSMGLGFTKLSDRFADRSLSVGLDFFSRPIGFLVSYVIFSAAVGRPVGFLISAMPFSRGFAGAILRTILLITPAALADQHGLCTSCAAKLNSRPAMIVGQSMEFHLISLRPGPTIPQFTGDHHLTIAPVFRCKPSISRPLLPFFNRAMDFMVIGGNFECEKKLP